MTEREPPTIQAVVFDLDDTLWRQTAPPDFDAITALQVSELMPHGSRLGFDHLDLTTVVRQFWAVFDATYPDPEGRPDAPIEERRWTIGPAMIQATLADHGVVCSDGDAAGLWAAMHDVPQSAFNYRLFPDAVSTLSRISAMGLPLAVATARPLGAAIVARELAAQGVPDVFTAIATSGEAGYRKPHRLVFETAVRRLGVQAEKTVVVGDSYNDDIVPAAALGMIPVLKLNDRDPHPNWIEARYSIRSLAELLRLEIFQEGP